MGRLANLETLLTKIGDAHEAGNETENKMFNYLHSMHHNQLEQTKKSNEEFASMVTCIRSIEEHIISLKLSAYSAEKLEGMLNLLKVAEDDRKAERNALRSAFGQFAMSNDSSGKSSKVREGRKVLRLDHLINGKNAKARRSPNLSPNDALVQVVATCFDPCNHYTVNGR